MAIDPDAAALPQNGLFGLPDDPRSAQVHVLGVPFDATASYRPGAARGPEAIRAASRQVELFDLRMQSLEAAQPFEAGLWMAPIDERVLDWNRAARPLAERVIAAGGATLGDKRFRGELERVNAIGAALNQWVFEQTRSSINDGKLALLVGGDHSTSFGSIRAHAERFGELGILQFDAHADLRINFEGFTWSHASILHNVLARIANVERVVQIGVRDLGRSEHDRIRASRGRIHTLFGHEWRAARLRGGNLHSFVQKTLHILPHDVYITFDIDGLEPHLCPNTGTPVPGGLEWEDALCFVEELVRSGRRIVGFDLTEVAPGPTRPAGTGLDEIVGARLLYTLTGYALASR